MRFECLQHQAFLSTFIVLVSSLIAWIWFSLLHVAYILFTKMVLCFSPQSFAFLAPPRGLNNESPCLEPLLTSICGYGGRLLSNRLSCIDLQPNLYLGATISGARPGSFECRTIDRGFNVLDNDQDCHADHCDGFLEVACFVAATLVIMAGATCRAI